MSPRAAPQAEPQATKGPEAGAAPVNVAVLLTYNEERHIARALGCVHALGWRVVIVDGGSRDRTVEIARALGAVVAEHRFVNYALQFQWALDNLPFATDWILRLDADEVLTPELVAEIRARLPLLPADVTGVNLKRRHIFMGRWIRHGGRYPLTLLRIWRAGAARIEQRWMDEHMRLLSGRAVTFDHDFADWNLNDLTFFTAKHNSYATREAIDVLIARLKLAGSDAALTGANTSRQAAAKRWLKESLYNRLPLWAGPLGYFMFRYVVELGVLDGREGLVYHLLQGFWYRFLVAAKALEFERVLAPLPDREARLDALARLTGYARADLEPRG